MLISNNDLTCPKMHDACNREACPQYKTCEDYLKALHQTREKIQENTLQAITINLAEHGRIVHFIQDALEECEDVPDGLISILSLLGEDMKNNVNLLCSIQNKMQ